jgi:hypothetical protein
MIEFSHPTGLLGESRPAQIVLLSTAKMPTYDPSSAGVGAYAIVSVAGNGITVRARVDAFR